MLTHNTVQKGVDLKGFLLPRQKNTNRQDRRTPGGELWGRTIRTSEQMRVGWTWLAGQMTVTGLKTKTGNQ